MLEEFTLSRRRGGATETRTLKAWGLDEAVHDHRTLGATSAADDELRVSMRLAVDAAWPFLPNDRIELFDSAGVRRYVGWACPPARDVKADAEIASFVFESPMRFLKSTALGDAPIAEYGSDGAITGTVHASLPAVTLNRIFFSESDGTASTLAINMRTQIGLLLAQAKAYGNARGAAPFDYDTTGIPAIIAPEQQASSASVGSCIETVRKFLPGISMVIDYAVRLDGSPAALGDAPVIRFVFVKTIDMDTGAAISPPTLTSSGATATHDLPNDGSLFEQFAPLAQYEQVIGTLGVFFVTEVSVWDGVAGSATQNTFKKEISFYSSTIANGSPVTVFLQMELRKAEWNGERYVDPEVLVNLATLPRLLHMANDRVYYSFQAVANDNGFHWEWLPANLGNLTGAGGELASAFAVFQGIKRDLKSGKVTLTTGTPRARGAGDLQSARAVVMTTAGNKDTGGGLGGDAKYSRDGQEPPKPTTPIAGPAGADAVNPNFSATVATSASPSVVITGTYPNLALEFYLPSGATPTLAIGSVTGGSTADATITGTAPAYVLNLVLPTGAAGQPGPQGEGYPEPPGNGLWARRVTDGVGSWEAL